MMKLAKAIVYTLTLRLDWLDVLISLSGLLLVIFNNPFSCLSLGIGM
jgi:hypothetical protein